MTTQIILIILNKIYIKKSIILILNRWNRF